MAYLYQYNICTAGWGGKLCIRQAASEEQRPYKLTHLSCFGLEVGIAHPLGPYTE